MSITFAHLLREIDEKYRNRIAFRIRRSEEIREISYHTFVSDVAVVGGWFNEKHYQGKNIGLIGRNSYEWLVWFFAAIISGAVAVPINKMFSVDMVEDIVKNFDIHTLLYDPEELDLTELEVRSLVILKDINHIPKADQCNLAKASDPGVPACILLTSGTTGIPKGVMLSQKNLLTPYDEENTRNTKKVLTVLPLHHISGIYDILKNLIPGNCIALNDSAKYFLKDLQLFQPEQLFLVPGYIKMLLEALDSSQGRMIYTQLTGITSCGAPIQPEYQNRLNRYGIDLWQAYGLTETAGEVSLCSENLESGGIGRICSWNEIAFEDGEIKIKGDNVMLGYYKNPAATKEVLKNGWLYTGDTGFMDEKGFIHINGRKKNLIILSNGENISPEELELMLGKNIYIHEVVVKALNDKVCAEIYSNGSKSLSKSDIQKEISDYIRKLNRGLPPFKQIRKIIYREDEFEKTAVGKIKR